MGLLQYAFLPDLRIYKNLGFDDHYYRLAGPLLDPNYYGAILASLSLFFLAQKNYLIVIINLLCLSLTFSRASYLSFIIPLFIFWLKNKKVIVTISLILATLIFISPKPFGEGVNLFRTYSINSRIQSSINGLNSLRTSPIFGQGFGSVTSIDNSYIYILTNAGILGLIGLLYLLYSVFQVTLMPARIVLSSILVHSLFNNSLFYIWILYLFWVFVGLNPKEYK